MNQTSNVTRFSPAEMKPFLKEVGHTDIQFVVTMLFAIVSCINGNAHGGFISCICADDVECAKRKADKINQKYVDMYMRFMKHVRGIKPTLIKAVIEHNEIFLEETVLTEEETIICSTAWNVYKEPTDQFAIGRLVKLNHPHNKGFANFRLFLISRLKFYFTPEQIVM